MQPTSIIVIGALNTDIIAAELDSFPRPNDPVYGGTFKIGPGGKPGNIASMAGRLSEPGQVAIISKTVEDSHGLWKHPVDGLRRAGVNTDYVTILKSDQTDQHPSIAMVAVNKQGDNMCFILPGISQEFNEADIDRATPLFEAAAKNNGILAVTLECPLPTVKHAMSKAAALGLRVAFDPGGFVEGMDISDLLRQEPFLFKPNEFEAKMVSGIEVTEFETAHRAAAELKQMGAHNVLITHGKHGGYLFAGETATHISIPEIEAGSDKDATGCGDESMAALCVYLQAGKSLKEASEAAILAGTLEFHKLGCQPITPEEIEKAM